MATLIRAQITGWVSDEFPGIVECRFADRFGREWSVIEKLPVVAVTELRPDSQFPQPCSIACEIVGKRKDGAGREIADVIIVAPWGLEATDGTTSFELLAEQIYVDPDACPQGEKGSP